MIKQSTFELWELRHYLESISKMNNIPDDAKVIILWEDRCECLYLKEQS